MGNRMVLVPRPPEHGNFERHRTGAAGVWSRDLGTGSRGRGSCAVGGRAAPQRHDRHMQLLRGIIVLRGITAESEQPPLPREHRLLLLLPPLPSPALTSSAAEMCILLRGSSKNATRASVRHHSAVMCPTGHSMNRLMLYPNESLDRLKQQRFSEAFSSACACLRWSRSYRKPVDMWHSLVHRNFTLRRPWLAPAARQTEGDGIRATSAECSRTLPSRRLPLLRVANRLRPSPSRSTAGTSDTFDGDAAVGVVADEMELDDHTPPADDSPLAVESPADESLPPHSSPPAGPHANDLPPPELEEALPAAHGISAGEEFKEEEDDDLIPLEQWKAQALKRLQTEAITQQLPGHLEAPLSPEGETTSPPIPFVRPNKELKDRFNYLDAVVGAKVGIPCQPTPPLPQPPLASILSSGALPVHLHCAPALG